MEIAGTTAFIAGGGGAIGGGIARALAKAGSRVVLADLSATDAEAGADQIRKSGGEALGLALEVTDPGSWAGALDRARAAFGPIDILVNTAAIASGCTPLEETAPDRIRKTFEINVMGVVHGMQAVTPEMRGRGRGRIVTFASLAAVDPIATMADYCMSKAGVIAISQSLAAELAGTGVGVTYVCCGLVRSGLRANTDRMMGETTKPFSAPITATYLEPDEVGEIIREAIARDETSVFTHMEDKPKIEKRMAEIMSGFAAAKRFEGRAA